MTIEEPNTTILAERITALANLVGQRLDAMDNAVRLQLVETLRRLDSLNHAHDQAQEVQAKYLPREVFDTNLSEWGSWRTIVESRAPTYVTFTALDRRFDIIDNRISEIFQAQSDFLARDVFSTYASIPFLPREVHEAYAKEQRNKAEELAAAIVRLQLENRISAEGLVRSASETAENLVKAASLRAETLAVSVDRRFTTLEKRIEDTAQSQSDYLLRDVFDQVLADFTDWRRLVDVRAAGFLTLEAAGGLLRREVFENYVKMPYLPRETHDNYAKEQAAKAEILAAAITRATGEARSVAENLVQTSSARSAALAIAMDRRADQVDQRLGAIDVRLAGSVTKEDAAVTTSRNDERFTGIADTLSGLMTRAEVQRQVDQLSGQLVSITSTVTSLSSDLAGQATGLQGGRANADRNRSLVFGVIAAIATIIALLTAVAGFSRTPTSTPTAPTPACSVAAPGQVCVTNK